MYDNPLGGVRKYEVVFEGYTLRKPLVVGPALVEEIADRLRAEGLVYHSKLLNDTLSALLQAYIRKGRAEVKTEIESPGFYLVDGKLVSVKYDIVEPDKERLKEALKLLNELADSWFKHCQDRFATVIKWGVVAPFSYVLKQRGRWLRWLYLYGDSATGKTTLGRVVLKFWGFDSRHEKTGASIDTVARFGYVISQSTFPVLVNEPGNALSREDVVEAVKNAMDTPLVRGKYYRATYIEMPALALIVFTSNKVYPQDDALKRRLLVVMFSFGDKIPTEKQNEFKERVDPRLSVLSEIGRCISYLAINSPNILDQEPLEAGKQLLLKCYELSGLSASHWLELNYDEPIDPAGLVIEEFAERFKKLVNDLFARYISRIVERTVDESRGTETTESLNPDMVDMKKKIEVLLEKNMIPGIRMKEGKIAIITQLLREIGLDGRVSLKSLAEIMGWKYGPLRVGNTVVKAAMTELGSLLELLE